MDHHTISIYNRGKLMSILSDDKRTILADLLAQKWADETELDDLVSFFQEKQEEFLQEQSESDFLNLLKENGIDWEKVPG